MQQGQKQENIRAWTNGDMLTPALRALRVARIDPDDAPTTLAQAVEDRTSPFQVHKTPLADGRIRPQEDGHIGMGEVREWMDEWTAMHDLRSRKLVLAILAAGRKHIARAERLHEAEHGQQAQSIKRQRVAEVDTDGVGPVALQNRPQALRQEGHRRGPGEARIATVRLPL